MARKKSSKLTLSGVSVSGGTDEDLHYRMTVKVSGGKAVTYSGRSAEELKRDLEAAREQLKKART